MKTIHVVRHQHHGFVLSHVFAERPTPKQIEPILAELEQRHEPAWVLADLAQLHDPTFKAPAGPWICIVEVPLLEAGELPEVKLHHGPKGPASGVGRVG